MNQLWLRLRSWLFVPLDPILYALLRIFCGVSASAKFVGINSPLPKLIQGKFDVGFPIHRYSAGNFAPGILPGDWLPAPTYAQFTAAETVAMVLGVVVALGLLSRLSSLALGLLCWWMLIVDPAGFKHNLWALSCCCILMATARCGDRLSLDAWLRARLGRPARGLTHTFSLRLLQVQMAVIYFFSVAVKLGDGWSTGHLLASGIPNGVKRLHALDLEWLIPLLSWRPLYIGLAWVTVGIEAFLIVGFFSRRWRPWAFFLGVCLHTGIDIGLDVGSYSLTMFTLYIAFIEPLPRQTKVTAPPSWARLLRALDWLCRLDVHVGSTVVVERDGVVEHSALPALLRVPLAFPFAFVVDRVRRIRRR